MSFFNLKECRTINKTELFYNYKPITIYNSDISEKTNDNNNTITKKQNTIDKSLITKNNNFYKIQVNNITNKFTYNDLKPSEYTLSNIYFYGLIHNNISDITTNNDDIVGEIVLEHTSYETNTKIYVCVLIRKDEQKLKSTMIDKLVSNIQKLSDIKYTDFDLNVEIPEQTKCIHYKDFVDSKYSAKFGMYGTSQTNNEIFIFIEPIVVTNESVSFFNSLSYETNLFKIDAPIYPTCINFQKTTIEGFVEGIENTADTETDTSNYMECTLANESEETVLSTVVPINDSVLSSLNGYRMIVHSLLIFIIILISTISIPLFYKLAVINNIELSFPTSSKEDILNQIQGADIVISLILLTHVIIYFIFGITVIKFNILIFVSIAFFIFYTFGFLLIKYYKEHEWKIENPNFSLLNALLTFTSISQNINYPLYLVLLAVFVIVVFYILIKLNVEFNFYWIFLMPVISIIIPIFYLSIIANSKTNPATVVPINTSTVP